MFKLIPNVRDSWIVEKWKTVAWQYAHSLQLPLTPRNLSIHIRPPSSQTAYQLLLSEPSDSLRAVTMFSDANPWARLELPVQPAIVVDLGANNGFSSLYWRTRFPAASIYGVEMDLSNVELCRTLFSCNRLEGSFLHTAIGACNGSVAYRSHASHTRNRLADLCDAHYEYGEESVQVSCQTLSTLLNSNRIALVDLLKVDIEGAERFLLDSIREWAGHVRFMLLELHHNIDLARARNILTGAGFEIVGGDDLDRIEWWCYNAGIATLSGAVE